MVRLVKSHFENKMAAAPLKVSGVRRTVLALPANRNPSYTKGCEKLFHESAPFSVKAIVFQIGRGKMQNSNVNTTIFFFFFKAFS